MNMLLTLTVDATAGVGARAARRSPRPTPIVLLMFLPTSPLSATFACGKGAAWSSGFPP